MLKVIVIVFLIIIGLLILINFIFSKIPILKDNYYIDFKSNNILEQKYSGLGEYDVSYIKFQSEDKKIKEFRIWYPSELKCNNQTYPLIIVTNASNTPASKYEPFFKRLASWGFIVVGNEDMQTGTGLTTSKTLDYVFKLSENSNSIFYLKINKENIGIIGYSQGGAGAINAITKYNNSNLYKTLFTGSAAFPLLSKNMGWEYDYTKITIPYFMIAGTGSSDAGENKENGWVGVTPLSSLVEIYNGMADDIFKVRARVSGAEHQDILIKTDGYMTAWMLYQLKHDDEAGKVFIGKEAEILDNNNWQDIEKNN